MKTEITTIKSHKKTKARLDHLKEHERETYDEVIRKILYVLNQIRKNPIAANKTLTSIDKTIKRKSQYEESEPIQTKPSPKTESPTE